MEHGSLCDIFIKQNVGELIIYFIVNYIVKEITVKPFFQTKSGANF